MEDEERGGFRRQDAILRQAGLSRTSRPIQPLSLASCPLFPVPLAPQKEEQPVAGNGGGIKYQLCLIFFLRVDPAESRKNWEEMGKYGQSEWQPF